MDNRFKIIVSNKMIYEEIEIPSGLKSLRIGTNQECEFRLRKELFFEPFDLAIIKSVNSFQITCSDNVYLTVRDDRKLITKELTHGDKLFIKYQSSDNELFCLDFMLDFDYEKKEYNREIDISGISQITIGGSTTCQVSINDPFLGSDSLSLQRSANGYIVTDNHSRYGVYVNGAKINKKQEIRDCDFFSIVGYSFYYKNGYLYAAGSNHVTMNSLTYIDISSSKSEMVYPRFNRSTRIKSVISDEKLTVLDPPEEPAKPQGNIILQLLPAIAMLGVTVVLRGVMSSSGGSFVIFSAVSMSIGIFTSVFSIVSDRKKYKRNVAERIEKYENYIENKRDVIERERENEVKILNDTYYSLEHNLELVDDFSSGLFNRDYEDLDFLEVRLGTGKKKSVRSIDYKQQEKLEVSDELAIIPCEIANEYEYIDNAPITISLKDNSVIGIVGETSKLYQMMKIMTLDLSIRQYQTDIKLFYIISEEYQDKIDWIRLLPHVRNEELGIRNIVCDGDSKNILFEHLYKELSRRENENVSFPCVVVFVLNEMGIKRHPISKYIEKANNYGFTFIFFENHDDWLPQGCNRIIKLAGEDNSGQIIDSEDSSNILYFSYTEVNDRTALNVTNRLAPIFCDEVSLEGSLIKNISLYQLLNIINVDDIDLRQNWDKSEVYKSMAAPLGVKSKNAIVYLDLNEKYHGPHGLVAGTTGSGKSEILQTYILSMATLFHPYEVGFVIIDFKGGGMVNQFKDLPHLLGAITNIDGREIDRSLLSIKAELKKRQTLFAENGVNHIDAYIKLYKKGEAKIPLPHLILIVDEFAELKMDQPEFMKELISAARIGRSLGVHLILATQKPSGVVDAQIWSNSKFKLCLKVQNKEDSNEVLKTPLAAEIKEPGRAYLQVGNNEIFDLFQSAYSGAPTSEDDSIAKKKFSIYKVALSGRKTAIYTKKPSKSDAESETQLEAIVSHVNAYCAANNIPKLSGICLPSLPDLFDYSRASKIHDAAQTVVPIGIYDDPENQCQEEVVLDVLSGNTMIIGSSQYGKTNLLQVLIRGIATNYSPGEVSIYILDFGSMALKVFDNLSHIGGVVIASEDEKLNHFMRMMHIEIKARKEIFSKMGITSFASYKEAGNTDIPHIVICIDNFIALKELYSEYEEDLIHLCREGIALGISIVMTSLQTNGISYKYMSNFANRICLYCNQGDEYNSLFDRCRMEPKNVPGRGLISINKHIYEYQTYLSYDGEREIDRVDKIKEFISSTNALNDNLRARRIPEVPPILDMSYVKENMRDNLLKPYQIPIGIDYETVEFVSVDLSKALTIGITGREGQGKTNILRLCMNYLQSKVFDYDTKAYIIDDFEKQLAPFSSLGFVEKYSIDVNDFEFYLSEMEEELKGRMERLQTGGIEVLEEMPLLLCVIQNSLIYTVDGISKQAIETFKRILKTYRQLKVCFIFANIENVGIAYSAPEMLKLAKDFNYMFVCDDLSNLKLLEINAAVLKKYKKLIERGDGYSITGKGIQKQKIIYAEEGDNYGQ